MKFSLTWLKDYLETDASVEVIAAKLNSIGLEVEGVEDPAARLTGFRIARVVSAAPHPNADKLQVLTVDAGDGDHLQVVCGAPNARAGLIGVLGLPGAVVPANGMELKKSAIRGVESNGMMCSTRELELGDDHDGIIELPANAPVGNAYADYAGSDPVFDVAITPNRQDCMGVRGIARDLAAAGLDGAAAGRLVAGVPRCDHRARHADRAAPGSPCRRPRHRLRSSPRCSASKARPPPSKPPPPPSRQRTTPKPPLTSSSKTSPRSLLPKTPPSLSIPIPSASV